jgi:sporulation protein YlmC with PRC-barrel domain
MRASDLQGKKVRTESGKGLGRVREIHVRGGVVANLTCGGGSFLQRFTGSHRGHRIDWREVRQVTPKEIVIADR